MLVILFASVSVYDIRNAVLACLICTTLPCLSRWTVNEYCLRVTHVDKWNRLATMRDVNIGVELTLISRDNLTK